MSFKLFPQKTALVLIDLQHGIVGLPTEPRSAQDVVATCRRLADTFREKGALVVFVRVDLNYMSPVLADVSLSDPTAPPPPPQASLIVPEANMQAGDILITKCHWDAFTGTELERTLREQGIEAIVLGGIATNMGVESTGRHAVALGFHLVLAEDACSALTKVGHSSSVENVFPLLSRVRRSAEILNGLV